MHGGGYGSEFDDGNEIRKRKRVDDIGYEKQGNRNFHVSALPPKMQFVEEYSREQRRLNFAKFKSLNAYERHKKLVHDYLKYYGGKIEDFASKHTDFKTDFDVIEENHQFVWDEEQGTDKTWGQRLAKKYYDKLFKEYCISDLSRYKHNQFAMRWRTEKEVQVGKGHFSCGVRKCDEKNGLKTWEVNFAYIEHEEKKNSLIKLRLCPDCSYKLNYHKKHKQIKKKLRKEKKKRMEKKKKKRNRKRSEGESSSSSSDSDKNISSDGDGNVPSTSKEDSVEDTSVWKQPIEEPTEKSKDDLFDDYLEDLFM